MSENRWQRVEEIFHRAVELSPAARAAFLDQACGGDESLRREVESLLDHESESGSTFAHPASAGLLGGPAGNPAGPAGSTGDDAPKAIAHYRITAKLGQGGMGAVYRATDTKLGREVAIKVLPAFFADDPDRLARFSREAKVLASLNHPNIAQIYGIEESNGVRALVMELVPGKTLASHVKPGPLAIETALNYAKQIADAFEAAHEKGITHRDLKPANVVVTPEGVVKVLDFGLAAVSQATAPSEASPTNSPTLTMRATQAGTIMGTAAYMSPEQASGKPVDKRSDIWSFGVVLFEMLAGKRLFGGETISHTLADVLRAPIDFDQLPRETPAAIRGLVRRCLERNVKNRLRDIGDARIVIEESLSGALPETVPIGISPRRTLLLGALAAAGLASALAVSFVHFREKPPAPAVPMHFQIQAPESSTLGPLIKLSPDGRKLAFIAGDRLWVHFFESGESRNLTEATGTPFWSPDSRYIGYPVGPGKLKKIEATGGLPQTVTDLRGPWGGATWSQDGVIVFSDRAVGLLRVPASGGVPVPITAFDSARRETDHDFPSFLPDGRHFVYTRRSGDATKSAIYLGSVDAKPEQQSSKPLANSNWHTECVPSADPGIDYLLFVSGGTLMAQRFDNRRLELTGEAAPVAEQLNDGRAFSSSANNILVFQQSPASNVQLAWYDREGKILGTTGDPGDYQDLALSSDGKHLAVTRGRLVDTTNIWLLDLSRSVASIRFTFGSLVDRSPVWSLDGSRIIFSSNRDGTYDLYQKPTDGSKDEEVLLKTSEDKYPTSWSRDGRFLLYTVTHPRTKGDIWVLPMEDNKKPVPFLITQFNEHQARFSPDGHWVAYTSDESGQDQVYVRSFSMNSAGTTVEVSGKWPISNGPGTEPRWRGDGRELFYRARGGRVMAVEIATNPAFRAGSPQSLGSLPGTWDSAADGKRFLVLASKSGPQPYTVILNWQAGLKK